MARTIDAQRNMKVHMIAAVMVMLVGMALPLDLASRTALLFCVALVFFAEILNTALESFVDLHVKDFHRQAMLAKDAAAAGVLVLAVATVAILVAILHHQWSIIIESKGAVLRSVALGVPLTIVVGLLLWWAKRPVARGLFFCLSVALAIPLWLQSTNPVFSVCLGGLLLLAAVSRGAGAARS